MSGKIIINGSRKSNWSFFHRGKSSEVTLQNLLLKLRAAFPLKRYTNTPIISEYNYCVALKWDLFEREMRRQMFY